VNGILVSKIFLVKKFVQNACQRYLWYNDLTYEVYKQKTVLKLAAAM